MKKINSVISFDTYCVSIKSRWDCWVVLFRHYCNC